MTDSQKMLYGCERDTTFIWEVGDYKLKRCPVSSITDSRVFNYIRAYNRYKSGYGPEDGGWMSWPDKFNKVIDIIEGEIAKIEKAQKRDREKKK